VNETVKDKNFIPAYRLHARQRRRRLGLWASVCVLYLLVAAGAYLFCCGVWGGDHRAQAEELSAAKSRIQQRDQAVEAIQRDLKAAEAMLRAAREVGEQPDWSTLLALLAKSLNDDLVLRQCELRADYLGPSPLSSGQPMPPANSGPFSLKLVGYGRTQEAVSRFVLQLEQADLFDQVKLIRTSREPFLAEEAIAFQVECTMGGKAGSPQ